MRITILCHDVPFPPNHGGRVDMWRRIQAFSRLGAQLQIIAWGYEAPTAFVIDEIRRYAEKTIHLQIGRDFWYRIKRTPQCFRGSLYAGIRWPSKNSLNDIVSEVNQFKPSCVWLDGFHGGLLALYLKKTLNVPFFYRSQNVEHLYIKKLTESSSSIRSAIAFKVGRFNLKNFEKKLIEGAECTYDISLDDLGYWKKLCNGEIRWLPPLLDWTNLKPVGQVQEKFDFDVLFLGNLNTENNVSAVRWLLEQVVPHLLRDLPKCRIGVAGSNPSHKVTELCDRVGQVQLIPNPPESGPLLQASRVLVNPMLGGSGVKLKSLDMLASGRPVVSTSEGVSGLPAAVKKHFAVADTPASFAAAVVGFVKGGDWEAPRYEWLSGQFGIGRIQCLISEMERYLEKKPSS